MTHLYQVLHVVTMPPAVFEKMYNHVLTDKGLYLFDMDWAKVKKVEKSTYLTNLWEYDILNTIT